MVRKNLKVIDNNIYKSKIVYLNIYINMQTGSINMCRCNSTHERPVSRFNQSYPYDYYNYNSSIRYRTSLTDNHFRIWKQRIDNYVFDKIGLHLDDLPDQCYRQWFDDGYLRPREVASIVLGEFYQVYNLNDRHYD